MIKTCTENDLVRLLYDELSEYKKQALQETLLTDSELQNEMEDLQSLTKDLDGVNFSPSKRTIDKILQFSIGYHKQSV